MDRLGTWGTWGSSIALVLQSTKTNLNFKTTKCLGLSMIELDRYKIFLRNIWLLIVLDIVPSHNFVFQMMMWVWGCYIILIYYLVYYISTSPFQHLLQCPGLHNIYWVSVFVPIRTIHWLQTFETKYRTVAQIWWIEAFPNRNWGLLSIWLKLLIGQPKISQKIIFVSYLSFCSWNYCCILIRAWGITFHLCRLL